jgi:hypothetical protein
LNLKLSVSDVDRLIENLDEAMNMSGTRQTVLRSDLQYLFNRIVERCYSSENVKDIWEQFSEYCKQNELDPAQQIKEAVISYYLDILRQYKTRIVNGAFE